MRLAVGPDLLKKRVVLRGTSCANPCLATSLHLSLSFTRMLAFDLETTGPDPLRDDITCAAVYDPQAGVERFFLFSPKSRLDDPEEFMLLLDTADRLCAFNGARFDIPLIQRCFQAPPARVAAWRLKLHDVFEACKLALDVTFSLQSLLELNCMAGKTGSGADAVKMAEEGWWDQLGMYCLNDTRQTHRVSSLDKILLPRTKGICLSGAGVFFAESQARSLF